MIFPKFSIRNDTRSPETNDKTVTNVLLANLYKNSNASEDKIIAVVEFGSIVQIIEPWNWWYKVKVNGQTGYIREDYLDLVERIVE